MKNVILSVCALIVTLTGATSSARSEMVDESMAKPYKFECFLIQRKVPTKREFVCFSGTTNQPMPYDLSELFMVDLDAANQIVSGFKFKFTLEEAGFAKCPGCALYDTIPAANAPQLVVKGATLQHIELRFLNGGQITTYFQGGLKFTYELIPANSNETAYIYRMFFGQ